MKTVIVTTPAEYLKISDKSNAYKAEFIMLTGTVINGVKFTKYNGLVVSHYEVSLEGARVEGVKCVFTDGTKKGAEMVYDYHTMKS